MTNRDDTRNDFLPPDFDSSYLPLLLEAFHRFARPKIAAELLAQEGPGLIRDRLAEIEDEFFALVSSNLDARKDADLWRKHGFRNLFWPSDLAGEHCSLKIEWNAEALAALNDDLRNDIKTATWAAEPDAMAKLICRAGNAFADAHLRGAIPLVTEAAKQIGLNFALVRSALRSEATGSRAPTVTRLHFPTLRDFMGYFASF